MAYVGSKGTHLQVLVDHNQDPVPGPGDVQSRRPYPQYGPFTSIENHGNSSYHSLQLKAEKRFSRGLMFLTAFTYSKSINDQPEICCNGPWPQNSYDLRAEKGPSDFDNRFRWVSSFDYELPIGRGKRFLNSSRAADLVLGGWHVGGIVTFRSGFPFSPLMGYDPSTQVPTGFCERTESPTEICRLISERLTYGSTSTRFLFRLATLSATRARTSWKDPAKRPRTFRFGRLFSVTERFNIEFRAEAFNAFNHAVFAQPDNYITDGPGAAGVITSTVIPQRQMQFGLKLH